MCLVSAEDAVTGRKVHPLTVQSVAIKLPTILRVLFDSPIPGVYNIFYVSKNAFWVFKCSSV